MNEEDRIANSIKYFTTPNPEKAFSEEGYKLRNIENIIEQFGRGFPARPIFTIVIALLNSLRDFRAATPRIGYFADARNKGMSDKELKTIFDNLLRECKKAQNTFDTLDEKDKVILMRALAYCKQSILERIRNLPATDRLLPVWERSHLKRWVEN